MRRVERAIEIDASVERVFDLFSDFENFPQWMRNIVDVRRTGRRTSVWSAEARSGAGGVIEWEAETTVYEPDHRIAWRSVRGDVSTDGEAIFEETRRGTTLMRCVLGYDSLDRRSGPTVTRLFNSNPGHRLEGDLERFRHVVERRRGDVRYRERRYEHNIMSRPVRERYPDGRRERSKPEEYYVSRRDRFDRNREYDMPGGRERRDFDSENYRMRDDYAGDREADRERRFGEALREARRSQIESERQYATTRERDESLRDRRSDQRSGVDTARSGDRYKNETREVDQGRPPRYALTPREMARERRRERERGRTDASEKLLQRGVDRILDEPPSSRWRR